MKKYIAIGLMLCGVLVGCGGKPQTQPKILNAKVELGARPYVYYGVCIDGVSYYEITNGVTVALGKDSKIIPCGE